MFKARSPIGTFKFSDPIGKFRYINPVEFKFVASPAYGEFRTKVERFHSKEYTEAQWGAYTEYRLIRAVGHFIDDETPDKVFDEYNTTWDEFVNREGEPDAKGARPSIFARALCVDREVLAVDPWAP